MATLGIVHVPGPPVEASIALSILLLACEIVRRKRGEPSLAARWPWLVAFAFGMLHGFGFASALSDIGLPRGDIPLALFAFNVGVEIGQLMFIGLVLGRWRVPSAFVFRSSSSATLSPLRPTRSAAWPRSGSSIDWPALRVEGIGATAMKRTHGDGAAIIKSGCCRNRCALLLVVFCTPSAKSDQSRHRSSALALVDLATRDARAVAKDPVYRLQRTYAEPALGALRLVLG